MADIACAKAEGVPAGRGLRRVLGAGAAARGARDGRLLPLVAPLSVTLDDRLREVVALLPRGSGAEPPAALREPDRVAEDDLDDEPEAVEARARAGAGVFPAMGEP